MSQISSSSASIYYDDDNRWPQSRSRSHSDQQEPGSENDAVDSAHCVNGVKSQEHDDDEADDEHDDGQHHDDDGSTGSCRVEEAGDGYGEELDHIDDASLFPTLPAFTVPVEIRPTPWLGPNQYGVFATEDIPPRTNFWRWTHRVVQFHHTELEDYIRNTYPNCEDGGDDGDDASNLEAIRCFLRRGFVLPAPYDMYWNSNPTDAGCYMNHSSTSPNCVQPHGTNRWVRAGEELTMDYSMNGNPTWYIDICHRYGMMTAREIAEQVSSSSISPHGDARDTAHTIM
jgi:hypothetical protein